MYIVKKTIAGKDYYYLRKSVRKGNKVISKSVAYLGKNKEAAERKAEGIARKEKSGKVIGESKEIIQDIKEKGEKSSITMDDKASSILTIEEISNFCKEKGFVFRSSDIYGGFAGFWDFGPLGIELFNNIKKEWWNFFVIGRDNMVGMEASIISHPRIWEASGHVTNFNVNDYLVTCKKCKKSSKVDKPELGKVKCECGGEYDWEKAQIIEQMFKTRVGSTDKSDVYLRGETAQGMFSDFKIIQQTSRMQLPFGIAQIGRCFRNEIAPRDFLFRCREFHIGEFEFFINPEEKKCELLDDFHLDIKLKLLDSETQMASSLSSDNENSSNSQNFALRGKASNNENSKDVGKPEGKLRDITIGEMISEGRLEEWHAYWLAEQILWLNSIGLNEIKIREHKKDELSHYSSATFDIDYEYVFGSKEIAGNANRGQFDLTNHQKYSGVSMEIYDEKYKNKIIPKVIEPTFGMERVFLAILTKAYNYDKGRGYIVLKIPPKLAPIKAAVFPIVKQGEYVEMSEKIVRDLRKEWNVVYDKGGSIGRRYARNDEIGTPLCITVDEQSLKKKDVTIRDRDSTLQIRVKVKELKDVLKKLINNEISFIKAGKVVETRVKEENQNENSFFMQT